MFCVSGPQGHAVLQVFLTQGCIEGGNWQIFTKCLGLCVVCNEFEMYAVVQVFLTRDYLAISMEFAQGGDLFAYTLGPNSFGKLAEVQARWIFQQLILGLDYCHRKVLHCAALRALHARVLTVVVLRCRAKMG